MNTYISLLRGINIGGRNIIKMEALRAAYMELGFTNVQSYIQSGNLIFSSEDADITAITHKIEAKILAAFGLKVPTVQLLAKDFKAILAHNTIASEDKNASELHVVFLAMPAATDENMKPIALLKQEKELLAWQEKAVFLYCPDGYHKSKIHNNYLENQLKTTATTRNWRTCQKILAFINKV